MGLVPEINLMMMMIVGHHKFWHTAHDPEACIASVQRVPETVNYVLDFY